MNKFALLPIFILLFFSTKAQDRIISTNNDTIHCAILSINNERILYELKNKDGSITGKFILLSQVAEYSRAHQQEINSKIGKQKTPKPVYTHENPWRFGLNVGVSTMPKYFDHLQSPSTLPGYYSKLKSGFHINTNFHYMITDFFGLGVEYSFLKTSTSGSMVEEYSPSIFLMVSENYRQYINYLGSSVLFQQNLDGGRKLILSESLSAGVLFIRLENQIAYPNVDYSNYTNLANNSLLTGKSFSAKLGLAAEYRLFQDFSVGLGADFIWCSLKKASFESKGSNNYTSSSKNEELSDPIKLSRIDYSFVLRYHF